MNQPNSNLSGIALNFLPIEFSSSEVSGFQIDYQNNEHLRNLQNTYEAKFLLTRRGSKIFAVPILSNQKLPGGEPCIFSVNNDWSLFQKILEEGVRNFLRTEHPKVTVPKYGRVWMKVEHEGHDLVSVALSKERFALQKLNFLHIYREYSIEAKYITNGSQNNREFGVLIKISTSWQVSANITELLSKDIDPVGCYVVPLHLKGSQQANIGHKVEGCIRAIEGDQVRLVDFRDNEFVNSSEYTIEATLENFTKCAGVLLDSQAPRIMKLIRSEVNQLMSAKGQLERIATFAGVLSQKPISCAGNLIAVVANRILNTDEQDMCTTLLLEPPKYILKNRSLPVSGAISSALALQGPNDQDSFQKTTPHIAVITPKQYSGRVEQFMKTWRDGGLKRPYEKGFTRQYKLRGCQFRFIDFQDETSNPGETYRQACMRALKESQDIVRRYDLAFVITKDNHRLLGKDDPYLTTKASLMSNGVPVQEVKIETVDSSSNSSSLPFIYNNLALASYAKMGGTPWLLASPKGPGITHELVIGLGNAVLREGRFRQERYIGITTLFNYDGVYLLSNVSKECSYEDYPAVLEETLISSLEHVSIQKGWQKGERVRLVFHTFKPLKNIEIEAVKQLVQNKLSQYTVDFAFLVIGQEHPWVVYRPAFVGKQTRNSSTRNTTKGEKIPERGTAVILDEKQLALLCITGPSELKMADQGCPRPLMLQLNGASTFNDIQYLTRQVFEFTYMSWKTYNLEPFPITITYSNAIAKLLGRLRHIKNWNSDALQTTQLKESLWFL